MPTFELAPATHSAGLPPSMLPDGLGRRMLLHNARWFTRVRWFITLLCVALGISARLLPDAFHQVGFLPPRTWPLAVATILAIGNLGFIAWLSHLSDKSREEPIRLHIWLQIALDLVVITLTAHMVGTLTTFMSFAYLIHIVLSCVFFSRRRSLAVTLLAACLFVCCVSLEVAGVLTPRSILPNRAGSVLEGGPVVVVFMTGMILAGWFAIWHMASKLAGNVRYRDRQLMRANEQLVVADKEMNQRVLTTTHDLKAPFAGIDTSIQLLRLQHWDKLPTAVQDIVARIEQRGHTLSERIRDILTLGKLRAGEDEPEHLEDIDIRDVIEKALGDIRDKAEDRHVEVQLEIHSQTVHSDFGRLQVLFANLLANAVLYSHPHGRVSVYSRDGGQLLWVGVADEGIGIRSDALPHIFEEYFRTREANEFNRMSTGLGLAIVKEVAQSLGLKVRVTSEVNKGTTFEVGVARAMPAGTKDTA